MASEEADCEEVEPLAALKRVFLDVKFSTEKDEDSLKKQMANVKLRSVEGEIVKSVDVGIDREQYGKKVDAIVSEFGLNADDAERLRALDEDDSDSGVLVEVAAAKADHFGFVAAAASTRESAFDLAHVFYRVTQRIDGESKCANCFTSSRQKRHKRLMRDAVVINFMRVRVVEQLRIEGLTTRGQHHRKERFSTTSNQNVLKP